MNAVETFIDFELLFSDMPDIGCEHSKHYEDQRWHQGDATHYVKIMHNCPTPAVRKPVGHVYPACMKFIGWIESYTYIKCYDCRESLHMDEFLQVLGPIKE